MLHDLNLAATFCDQLVLLSQGSVLSAGLPDCVLTPQLLREAYGLTVQVSTDPLTGRPWITPLPTGKIATRARVHIIGGGGAAASLYYPLLAAGFALSTGVLNQGDTDWQLAKNLGIRLVEIPAFSPITAQAQAENLALIAESQVVVLAAVPFGQGNLENLRALASLKSEQELLLLQGPPIAERDYTAGIAAELYERVAKRGQVVKEDEFLRVLMKLGKKGS